MTWRLCDLAICFQLHIADQLRAGPKISLPLSTSLATHFGSVPIALSMSSPIRLTVLISGSGSNLQAVIDKTSQGQLPTQIVRVLSNRKDAFGLERAKRADIPTTYHNLVKYKKQHPASPEGVQAAREEYDAELARLVLQDTPDLVVCLGFMHVVSPNFLGPLEAAKLKIINLHPALPGAFNGVVSFVAILLFPGILPYEL